MQEIVHTLRRKGQKGGMIAKIDLEKVYDNGFEFPQAGAYFSEFL